jgi:hypothetical protein
MIHIGQRRQDHLVTESWLRERPFVRDPISYESRLLVDDASLLLEMRSIWESDMMRIQDGEE